jgi:hypothetical protein
MINLGDLSDYNSGGVSVNAGEDYDFLLYGGGIKNSSAGASCCYNKSLTVGPLSAPLSKLRKMPVGVNAGKYALFIGGYDTTTYPNENHSNADVYTM